MLNHVPNYNMIEDEDCEESGSQEWSLCKVTSLLSDNLNLSMYDNEPDMLQPIHSTPYIHSTHDAKHMKSEPITELLPSDSKHNAWQSKFIDLWDIEDCLFWFFHEIKDIKNDQSLTELRLEALADVDGTTLKYMSRETFMLRFPDCGAQMYERLQKVKSSFNSYYSMDWNSHNQQTDDACPRYSHSRTHLHTLSHQQSHELTHLDHHDNNNHIGYRCPSEVECGYKSEGGGSVEAEEEELPEPPRPEKRRPGRPRGTRKKKKPEKLGRLWEFIRDLLLNPQYNPSLICWEDYEQGMFRFVHSDRVAKLWGSKKENGDMNYEKLSRAMRYYYKSKVLQPVYGKRLVYKFGPTAKGWRSEHPIFR